MIGVKELKRLAQKNNINPYIQEKNYLQMVFLHSIYPKKRFVFKGGTALKIAYKYVRFSEDLDFNTSLGVNKIKAVVHKALNSFSLLGIEYKFVKEELFEKSYTAQLRFKGPLYTGRRESTNTLSLDIGKRKTLKTRYIQTGGTYSDIPAFFALVMDKEEIFAEKIRALAMRADPRDIFDVWVMKNDVNLNKGLVKLKFEEAKIKLENKIQFCSKKEYERKLKNLLPTSPSYEQVCEELKPFWKGLTRKT